MIEIDKIKTICSYLADNIDDLFVTKLMKFFYYIDFVSYAQRGASVTNDIYYKLPYGPVPTFIKNEVDHLLLNDLVEDNSRQLASNVKLEPRVAGDNIAGYVLKNVAKSYSLTNLSEYEIGLINRLIEKYKNKTAKFLSEQTHKEPPYQLTSDNSVIEYELANKLDISSILG